MTLFPSNLSYPACQTGALVVESSTASCANFSALATVNENVRFCVLLCRKFSSRPFKRKQAASDPMIFSRSVYHQWLSSHSSLQAPSLSLSGAYTMLLQSTIFASTAVVHFDTEEDPVSDFSPIRVLGG